MVKTITIESLERYRRLRTGLTTVTNSSNCVMSGLFYIPIGDERACFLLMMEVAIPNDVNWSLKYGVVLSRDVTHISMTFLE